MVGRRGDWGGGEGEWLGKRGGWWIVLTVMVLRDVGRCLACLQASRVKLKPRKSDYEVPWERDAW